MQLFLLITAHDSTGLKRQMRQFYGFFLLRLQTSRMNGSREASRRPCFAILVGKDFAMNSNRVCSMCFRVRVSRRKGKTKEPFYFNQPD